ncbi:MAG: Uma2 family endonuclease [Isosphaeraceae bacterium]|nr:Uma2 family endonuclease [Isosphaeraceae bacterium]
MATIAHSGPSAPGVVFHDATWDDYETMLRLVGDRPIRVTYDQGTMEVFMPSFGHEDDAHLLGRMIETLTDLLDIPMKAGRTTIHKRRDLDRGTEPDQCYWLYDNARRMVGKRQLDLNTDPAPDIVIEVDLTRSSLERLPLFAAMGVPEVWRLAGETLAFLHLQPDGSYQAHDWSRSFPALTVADAARFLDLGRKEEENAWARSFRTFVHDPIVPPPRERANGAE